MQKNLWAVCGAIIAVSMTGMSGCSKDKKPAQPTAPAPQAAQGPAWKLSMQAKCAYTEADQCVGAYGFMVAADGTYAVGPGPQQQAKQGKLAENELSELTALLAGAYGETGISAEAAESCESAAPAPAEGEESVTPSEDEVIVTYTHLEVSRPVFRTGAAGFCHTGGSKDAVRALHDAFVKLAGKYYALPFPDACADAVDVLSGPQGLFAGLQSCNVDADCAYVTSDFDLVPPSYSQYVFTDDCSKVRPLVAANASAFMAAQAKLQEALSNARQVCMERIERTEPEGCTPTGFTTSASAPAVCQEKVCRINPAATLGIF